VDSKLFTFSGGFQSFILEFSACYSLPGGFQETYLLGLALAHPSRFRTASVGIRAGFPCSFVN
jgi:hypothetical protein